MLAVDFTVLSRGPDEGAAGPFRRSRGRCAPCAAVATEEPGQVQPRSRRASSQALPTSWSSRDAMPKPNNWRGCRSRSARPSALPATPSPMSSSSRSSAASSTCSARDGKRSRSMRRSTRRSHNWEPERRQAFELNGASHLLALCFGPDRGRHRCGRTACEERRLRGSARTISIPPRRVARWRSA